MRPKGIFLPISDKLNSEFHAEIERRLGRPLRRGDIQRAGEEAISLWLKADLF